MGLFSKKVELMDVIRCDEPSYLTGKWQFKKEHNMEKITEKIL